MKKVFLFLVVLSLCTPLFAQQECSAIGAFSYQRATDSSGVVHDIMCLDYVTAKLSTPWSNIVTPSYPLRGPTDTAAAPDYSFADATSTGMHHSTIRLLFSSSATDLLGVITSGPGYVFTNAGSVIGFGSGSVASTVPDTGFSRDAAGIVDCGNGAAADKTCVFQYKRLRSNGGSNVVNGDFSISAGWGNTASITAVGGTDSAGFITVLSNGTGQAANPSITLTFHDGSWTGGNGPVCMISRGDLNTSQGVASSASSANTMTTFVGLTPVAATSYTIFWSCIGRP